MSAVHGYAGGNTIGVVSSKNEEIKSKKENKSKKEIIEKGNDWKQQIIYDLLESRQLAHSNTLREERLYEPTGM